MRLRRKISELKSTSRVHWKVKFHCDFRYFLGVDLERLLEIREIVT